MKTELSSITTLPCPELRGAASVVTFPAFVDIKYDGEFQYVHIEKNKSFCVNKYGKIRTDFPALIRLEAILKKHTSATFLAELIFNLGRSGSLYGLLSNKESDSLELVIFDILELDGEDLRNNMLIDRREGLAHLLPRSWQAGSSIVTAHGEIGQKFKEAVLQGCEGIVIKPLTGKLVLAQCDWAKVKYKDQTDYKILLIDKTQERLEVQVPTSQAGGYVSVGVKCPNKYKKFLKVGDLVTIEHQGVLAQGRLRHPVLIAKKEWK